MSDRERVWNAFRRWGYLQARLDSFGRLEPFALAELDVEHPEAEGAREVYCGSVGAEFMHIPLPERREWVAEQMEAETGSVNREQVALLLVRAETFEQVLQRYYIGTKRFSLEGLAALVPFLHETIEQAAEHGASDVVLGMSHRGRLNAIVTILGRSALEIFAEFEDVDPRSVLGGGDVQYHLGATGTFTGRNGAKLRISLVSNPSHLEAVDPIVMGRARAKQMRHGSDGRARVLPVTVHGDAGFAGQGITAETLNLAELPGYGVGGCIHVVANNLVGFTALPESLHSSRFASDVARRLAIPIFHVNGQDPDAVVRVARLAVAFRWRFGSDVVVDLIGYRLHGHSEVDDPTVTQPLLYRKIEAEPPLWQSYCKAFGLDLGEQAETYGTALHEAHESARKQRRPRFYELTSFWKTYRGGRYDPAYEVDTAVGCGLLEELGRTLASPPSAFTCHPKLERLLEKRRRMAEGRERLDYAMAEALAFATLLREGRSVRLTGQDSRRGTFNQRHAVLVDYQTGAEHVPLAHVARDQAVFECFDSPLSEAAVLGYEYGISRELPGALVLWEAQFGDFANGAQVIIDQFIAAGEDKWGLLSGLVLLLPHGLEGQGPDHSSARLERFLQLAAEDNIQVCQPSTAAQYFHLLRRQVLRPWRKPLVVLTPKAMLRHAASASDVGRLAAGRFEPVLADQEVSQAARIVVASGKIGHELRAERQRRGDRITAIVMLEQLYPFPEEALRQALEPHPEACELVWAQEEPANMGALPFVLAELQRIGSALHVRRVCRSASASPATGSHKAHRIEQARLLDFVFGPASG